MAISVIHHFNLNVNGRMGQVRENCLPPLLTIPTFLIILSHSVSQILKPKILISAPLFPSLSPALSILDSTVPCSPPRFSCVLGLGKVSTVRAEPTRHWWDRHTGELKQEIKDHGNEYLPLELQAPKSPCRFCLQSYCLSENL